MFVPGLWWHGVINLDLTIAITQNFCNRGNFERVWASTRKGRKRLSVNFLRRLKDEHPDLWATAECMNERDNFIMWDRREKYRHKFSGMHSDSSSITSSSDSSDISSSSESSSSDSHHRREDKPEEGQARSSGSERRRSRSR